MKHKNNKFLFDPDLVPLLIDTTNTLKPHYPEEKDEGKKTSKPSPKKGRKSHGIPKRYLFALLGFWGMANVYAMRVNLSVAILAMTSGNVEKSSNHSAAVVECPELVHNFSVNQTKLIQAQQYDWSEETVNNILGSFFYGYVLTQIPSGYLSEKMSGKWLYGTGVFLTSLLTLATPMAVSWGTDALVANRILEGMAGGITKPTMNSLISRWSPKQERSRVSSFIYSGALFGTVIALPVSGWLSSCRVFGGWPSAFYLFGILSLVWFLFWIKLAYDSPLEHPYITAAELEYFEENQEPIHKNPEIPWGAIFTSLPMWAVIVSHFGSNLGFLTLFTALPSYLKTVLHFDIEVDGYVSALPFLCEAIGAWTAAFAADKLRESEAMTITCIRKIFNTIGLLGPAAVLFFVTVSGCRPQLIVALICLTMTLHGFAYSGFQVTHIDMSPDFAGVLFGISSTFADLCGILGPALVTAFTYNENTAGNWNKVFYTLCLGYSVAAMVYLLFASAELQPWGLDKKALTIKASLSSELNNLLQSAVKDTVY